MRILFLGCDDSPLVPYLRGKSENVVPTSERIGAEWVASEDFDFLISYGYRHILKPDILSLFYDKAINLHISYLPWNRGADPNFWSFVENTPKGVTIHHLDQGVDTGDIIVQKELFFSDDETLSSTYATLRREVQELFYEHWDDIRSGTSPRSKQPKTGTVHRSKDKESYAHLLTEGWKTPVRILANAGGCVD